MSSITAVSTSYQVDRVPLWLVQIVKDQKNVSQQTARDKLWARCYYLLLLCTYHSLDEVAKNSQSEDKCGQTPPS